MKLYLLKPVEDLKKDDDPWSPWYDKCFGVIIRAETEEKAREIAHDSAGAENRGEFMRSKTADTTTPWKDSKYTICTLLESEGEEELIMQDYHST